MTMEGLDLNITYEDGLRLSELYGQLSGLQYESTHLLAVNASTVAMVLAVTALISFLITVIMKMNMNDTGFCCRNIKDGPFDCEYKLTWKGCVLLAVPWIIPVMGFIVCCIALDAYVDMSMLETQAQIDAILAKYGMT